MIIYTTRTTELKEMVQAVNESDEFGSKLKAVEENREKYKIHLRDSADEMRDMGQGVFCGEDIPEKVPVGMYTGSLAYSKEKRVLRAYSLQTEFYDDDGRQFVVITGNTGRKGIHRASRIQFYNHTCPVPEGQAGGPNCFIQHVPVYYGRNETIGLLVAITKRPIKAGEQLTYDYGGNILSTKEECMKLIAKLAGEGSKAAYYQPCICSNGRCSSGKGFVKMSKPIKKPGRAAGAGASSASPDTSIDKLSLSEDSSVEFVRESPVPLGERLQPDSPDSVVMVYDGSAIVIPD